MRIKTASRKRRSGFTSSQQDNGEKQINLNSSDYIFSQTSIVSSVQLERNSHIITPETSKYVNTNGDTWSNEALKSNYGSFIGAFNYVNHEQIPEKSAGFVADAALRKIFIDPEVNSHIYYTDILTATHRDHSSLVRKILSNEIEYLSMGCDCEISMCSRCGHKLGNDFDLLCDHLEFAKGKYYVDVSGKKRRIAELLGTEEKGSVTFTEASWLTEPPAFHGASRRHTLSIGNDNPIL
ncbi:MAG TPA: hypothetical protein ENI23_12230 [bacterium]|nr:hypothetical protein [bacterium]